MRIVLQHRQTGSYFAAIGQWTPSSTEAFNFMSSTQAMEFCLDNSFEDVDVVLKFEKEKYEIVMQEGWKRTFQECRSRVAA